MPQLAYPQNMPVAYAGMKADLDSDGYDFSAAALDVIPFGRLALLDRASDRVVLARANSVVITEDAGTWTAGNGIAVVNGVTVTVAYNATKAQTFADLVVAIAALDFVLACTYVAPALTITVRPGVRMYEGRMVITGITGTMTIAGTVFGMGEAVAGLSVAQAKEQGGSRRSWNDRAVMQLAGDALNAGDTITSRINGVACTLVTYAASEANTLQLIANAIKRIAGVADAVVDAAVRTVTITANPGLELIAAIPVVDAVLAAVAPTFTATYSMQADPIAVGDVAYLPTETVSVKRKGRLWVQVDEAIAFGDPVFVRVQPGTTAPRGTFRNDINGGTCVAVAALRFAERSFTAPDGTLVAPIEINLP